jgi:hypothetical protein
MGAAASTQAEHDELRAVFERFKTSPGNGDDLDAAAFAQLVREAAPTVHSKMTAAGGGDASPALAAFRTQLVGARNKLAAQAAPRDAAAAKKKAAALRDQHDWAADVPTNLQKGLIAGMLRSQALRLVPLELNGERIVALLDTGAERSALGVEATARCGLGELVDDSFTRRVGGFGGATDGCGRVHYCEMIVGGVPFRAAFDVLRFPANVEFEAIIGLDFLVRGRASIAIAEGTLTLHNHDGTPASVELLFPRENDALEAGREAAAVASVKGGGGAS